MNYVTRLTRGVRQFTRLPPDRRPRRLAWVVGRNLNYWLRQHARRDQVQVERLHGMELHVLPGVFNPTWFHTTPVFVEQLLALDIAPGSEVLELCTGSGAAAIALGGRGLPVTAVELNPVAVYCARLNAARNRVASRVQVLEGDLYGPVEGRRFDLIVSNPPFMDGVARTLLELAFLGGPGGEVLARLVLEAPGYLKPDGRLVISYSSLAEPGRIEALARQAGLTLVEVIRTDLWSEVVEHYVLRWEG